MAIKSLIDEGRFSKDTLTRLKVKILDGSQDDEADNVLTTWPSVTLDSPLSPSVAHLRSLVRAA